MVWRIVRANAAISRDMRECRGSDGRQSLTVLHILREL